MSQLVLQPGGPEGRAVDVVDNPTGRPAITFEDRESGKYIPRLGSQDFIKIAVEAARHGWTVEKFELVDVTGSYLDEDREEEVSSDLVEAALNGGIAATTEALVRKYPTFSVSGVELAAEDQTAVTLRRGGVLIMDTGAAPTSFIEEVWQPSRVA